MNKQNTDCLPSLNSSSYAHFILSSLFPSPSTIFFPFPPPCHILSCLRRWMRLIIWHNNFQISSGHSRHNICVVAEHGFAYFSQTAHKLPKNALLNNWKCGCMHLKCIKMCCVLWPPCKGLSFISMKYEIMAFTSFNELMW